MNEVCGKVGPIEDGRIPYHLHYDRCGRIGIPFVPLPINQGVSIMNEVNDLKMLTTDVAGLEIQSCRYLLIREESS